MAGGFRRFTEQEDRLIIRTVSKRSENLAYCFTTLAAQLDRKEKAVRDRYYNYLRPKFKENAKGAPFILGDRKKLNPMVKNVARGKEIGGIKPKAGKMKRILTAILTILAE